MKSWDRQWKLTKSEIVNHTINFSNPDYVMPEAIFSWPAHGDITKGQSSNLAPYIDIDNNNIYEPHNGDYPCIKGDEAIFMIRNDVGNFHTESGHYDIRRLYSTNLSPYIDSNIHQQNYLGVDTFLINNDTSIYYYLYSNTNFNWGNLTTEQFFIDIDTLFYENKIGLEQHLMFYSFDDSTNQALHHSIFVENTLYNRQDKNFDSLMVGIWNDSDLGLYYNDFIGCNVELNMGYCFNGDETDGGLYGYGTTPPAIGIKLLDTDMHAFVHYKNNNTVVTGYPENKQHHHNYLLAKWRDGLDITYGGDGRGGSIPSKFMFPGNSDPEGIGTNGLITSEDWEEPEGWTEENAGHTPGDRYFVQSIGPFQFHSGDVINLNYAFVWSRASEGDNLASVEKLFTDAQIIQDFFDTYNFTCLVQLGTYNCEVNGCEDPQNGTGSYSTFEECEKNCDVSIFETDFKANIFPNPSSNLFFVEFYSTGQIELSVTNILGEQVYFESVKSIGDISTQIDLSNYSKGVYNLTIKASNGISNHKLILH